MEIEEQLKQAAKNKLKEAKQNLGDIPNGAIKDYLESTVANLESGKNIDVDSFLTKIKSLINAN